MLSSEINLKIIIFGMTQCILIKKKSNNVSDKKIATIFRIEEVYIRYSCTLNSKAAGHSPA